MEDALMTNKAVISIHGLSKRFGPIEALRNVDLDIYTGELIGVVGDNGAGKSTLIKILSGVLRADTGEIYVNEKLVQINSPNDAARLGIETVYQDLALAPNLDVAGNVFLGREPSVKGLGRILGIVDRPAMIKRVKDELEKLEVQIPSVSGLEVGQMSGGQRQAVAITRTAVWASKVLLMDEPTAALGVKESEAVLRLIERILKRGIAVVMVSHILPHVLQLSNRVVVMRHGRKVAELSGESVTHDRLIGLIVGYEEGDLVKETGIPA
jgi:ABC-type sugar transport system ATPase subunit